MQALMEQFISESRDFLQLISDNLIQMETVPDDPNLISELFRAVHTLKGNSGLFDFPDMTHLLHAAEDLMDDIRNGNRALTMEDVDLLLVVADLVSDMFDGVEDNGKIPKEVGLEANSVTQKLRQRLNPEHDTAKVADNSETDSTGSQSSTSLPAGLQVDDAVLQQIWQRSHKGETPFLIEYVPRQDCFFTGEDPLHLIAQLPGRVWTIIKHDWEDDDLAAFDCFACQIKFINIAFADEAALTAHLEYVKDQVSIHALNIHSVVPSNFDIEPLRAPLSTKQADFLANPLTLKDELGNDAARPECAPFWQWAELLHGSLDEATWHTWATAIIDGQEATLAPAASSPPALSEQHYAKKTELALIQHLLQAQHALLTDNFYQPSAPQTIASVSTVVDTISRFLFNAFQIEPCGKLNKDASLAVTQMANWLGVTLTTIDSLQEQLMARASANNEASRRSPTEQSSRAEDRAIGKVLKVDQSKIDSLLSLVGELIVTKNALPYLAKKAEGLDTPTDVVRDLKEFYEVVNRLVEELQDSVMQVRMMPIDVVVSRFDRLVRDLSKKLGKNVKLYKYGEDTEADKNIIEVLKDPLVHIIRNSLDHGIEMPDERKASGKSEIAELIVRATSDVDSVIIQISDDGKGIDPEKIKARAIEKQVISREDSEKMSDNEALNLIFHAGFSTASQISELSGRGVGMDVVKTAIHSIGGNVSIDSKVGEGTTITLKLPLSMSMSHVMVIETNDQAFGVPMNIIRETVRFNKDAVQTIKGQMIVSLRDSVLPLFSLNRVLGSTTPQKMNDDDEYAALVIDVDGNYFGLIIDDYSDVIDTMLKPLPEQLAHLSCFAGTTLLGDGTVLMVLNVKGLNL